MGRAPIPLPPPDAAREATIAILALLCGALVTLVITLALKPATKRVPPPLSDKERSAPKQPDASSATGSSKKLLPTDVSPATLQALVEARRSVMPKDYTGALLPEWQVRSILQAAPWAPNHGHTEPWRFAVFAGERKSLLLDQTLAWYRARPASFWSENFVLVASGKPEFPNYEVRMCSGCTARPPCPHHAHAHSRGSACCPEVRPFATWCS